MPSSACSGDPRHLHSFPTRRSSDLRPFSTASTSKCTEQPTRSSTSAPLVCVTRSRQYARSSSVSRWSAPRRKISIASASPRMLSRRDRKSTRLNSSHTVISYAVFCLLRRPPTPTLFPYTTLFRSSPVLDRLDKQMHGAADSLEYERAARVRDQIASVRKVIERQQMVGPKEEDFDCIGLAEDALEARSEEHTSELQSHSDLVCRLLLAPATPDTYTLSLHDALPIFARSRPPRQANARSSRLARVRARRSCA